MARSKPPMPAPGNMLGWREMQYAASPIAKSSELCCGPRNSWWQEKNRSRPSDSDAQHFEPYRVQQLPGADESPRRQFFREALEISSIETFPKRNVRRIDLHPNQIIHTHIRLAENCLETVEQQAKLMIDVLWSDARCGVNANASRKVKRVAAQHCVTERQSRLPIGQINVTANDFGFCRHFDYCSFLWL